MTMTTKIWPKLIGVCVNRLLSLTHSLSSTAVVSVDLGLRGLEREPERERERERETDSGYTLSDSTPPGWPREIITDYCCVPLRLS